MTSRGSSPTFTEPPAVHAASRVSEARRRVLPAATATKTAKDVSVAEGDLPSSRSIDSNEAFYTHRESDGSLQNSQSHAHTGRMGDTSVDGHSDLASNCSLRSPPQRPSSSLAAVLTGPVPPLPRRKISAPDGHAADVPSSPSMASRRMWTHFAEREILIDPHHPAKRSSESEVALVAGGETSAGTSRVLSVSPTPPPGLSSTSVRSALSSRTVGDEKLGAEPYDAKVSDERAEEVPLSEKKAPSSVVRGTSCAASRNPASSSPSPLLSPSMTPSSETTGSILQVRSPARRSSACPAAYLTHLQLDASRAPQLHLAGHNPVTSATAIAADGRAASSAVRHDDHSTPALPESAHTTEVKDLTSFLPALNPPAVSWGEENGAATSVGSNTGPTALSLTRPRQHQLALPRRFSRQFSLSFEYAEESKGIPSVTTSDSFPPHGLSPSSAVTSEAQLSVPPIGDLPGQVRAMRADLRSTSSSTNSPQRQDLDIVPPRCSSTTLAERRSSLATPSQQHKQQQQQQAPQRRQSAATRRIGSATFCAPRTLAHQPPRTRSAAYTSTPRSIRGTHPTTSVDSSCFVTRGGGQSRSSSTHSARLALPPCISHADETPQLRSTSSHSTRVPPLSAEVPLLPRLNPLLHSPSSAPRVAGVQPLLTPLHCQPSSGSAGCESRRDTADEALAPVTRSRSPSVGDSTSLYQPATSLAFPHLHQAIAALPSIPAIPRAASGCMIDRGEDGDDEEDEQKNVKRKTRSGCQRSTPRQSRASCTTPSVGYAEEENAVYSSGSSPQDGSAAGESGIGGFVSPMPPPPPWTPAEALYWMSGRLTRQEALEMRTYKLVYYCGPAVPPRTACGVSESAPAPSREKEAAVFDSASSNQETVRRASDVRETREESQASLSSPFHHNPPAAAVAETISSPSPYSPSSSYFPVTLRMHISFRYEVIEVLGFGTFSVVVRAIDHAASPLDPERHCALKLIRKEDPYLQAAQDEWDVYAKVKACCGASEEEEKGGDRDRVGAALGGPPPPPPPYHHRRRFSSGAGRATSFMWRLSLADQRTLRTASVLTPRTQFGFRGYLVMVFPLLGFNVRDVLDLRRESDEFTAAGESESSAARCGSPTAASATAAEGYAIAPTTRKTCSPFPSAVGASILAQVLHALAFLHSTAHLLHGDLKPENVVFVDRTLSQGFAETSPTVPFNSQQYESFSRTSERGATTVAAAAAGASTPPTTSAVSLVSFPRSSGGASHRRAFSENKRANVAAKEGEEKSAGESSDVSSHATSAAVETTLTAASIPSDSTLHWLRVCGFAESKAGSRPAEGEEAGESAQQRSLVKTGLNWELQSSPFVAYAPHSPSRRTPGLTASRTGTLSSPRPGRLADVLTLEDSENKSGAASPSPATPSAVEAAASRASFAGSSHSMVAANATASQRSARNMVSSRTSDLTFSASTAQTTSRVAVIDLGHAKPLAPGQTGDTFPLQSPSYRAPEMALRLPYTSAIDMWSLGCVLYELFTGRVLFCGASDDATMLASAVEALGMPDAAFLSMVKVCWKAYKQRKVAGGGTSSRSSSIVIPRASLSMCLTESDPAEDQNGGGTADFDGKNREKMETAAALPALSEEEAVVERCWRSFIEDLNSAAGQQRTRTERRRRQSTSIFVTNAASSEAAEARKPDGGTAEASVTSVSNGDEEDVVRVTTWETPAQCALLSELFPDGQANATEQTFALTVSMCLRRPSTSASVLPPLPREGSTTSAAAKEERRRAFERADFLLGCLYWDAAERLSSVEAQYHPYVAAHFTSDAANSDAACNALATAALHSETAAATLSASTCGPAPPHCSGVYYLQHHPLTARLFLVAPSPNANRRDSGIGDAQQSVQSPLLQTRRFSAAFLPLQSLASAAIVPFELPSNMRAAPSSRAWEDHEQQQQQQQHPLIADQDAPLDAEGGRTPREQRVSVFCGRSLLPPENGAVDDTAHVHTSTATTPFRMDAQQSDECASMYDVDLISPDREGLYEEVDARGDAGRETPQGENEVMVLRLD